MHDFVGKANPKTRFAPLNQRFFFPVSRFRNLANLFSENEKRKTDKKNFKGFSPFSQVKIILKPCLDLIDELPHRNG